MALRNHYIAHSNATFDEQPLSMPAIESWMAGFSHQSRHCMWVACIGPEVVGFSSSRPYRDHPAFSRTVETAVYVKPGCTSTGLGSALYAALFDSLASLGLHRAVTGIALPNEASVGGGPCKGLWCQVVTCDGGKKTSLSGVVYDPADDHLVPVPGEVRHMSWEEGMTLFNLSVEERSRRYEERLNGRVAALQRG